MNSTTTIDNIDTLIDAYKQARRNEGAGKTDAAWLTPIIKEWVAILGGADAGIAWQDKAAAAMNVTLSIRDAMLVAAIDRSLNVEQLTGLAVNPHSAANRALMEHVLTKVFEDPAMKPEHERMARAAEQFTRIADRCNGVASAQPIAAAAYIEWWNGDTDAAAIHAILAASLDEDANLALMVAGAIGRGIKPAYLR
mgnify:CR=1 FL=1